MQPFPQAFFFLLISPKEILILFSSTNIWSHLFGIENQLEILHWTVVKMQCF